MLNFSAANETKVYNVEWDTYFIWLSTVKPVSEFKGAITYLIINVRKGRVIEKNLRAVKFYVVNVVVNWLHSINVPLS